LDAVVYNAESPLLAQAVEGQRLSSIVYTADSSSVLGTIVNGRWVVKRGKHLSEENIRKEFLRHILKLD
jgi:formimidoylglutamate deiminase